MFFFSFFFFFTNNNIRTQFLNPRADPVTGEILTNKLIDPNGGDTFKGGTMGGGGVIGTARGTSKRDKQDRATSVEALDGFYSDDEDGEKKNKKKKKIVVATPGGGSGGSDGGSSDSAKDSPTGSPTVDNQASKLSPGGDGDGAAAAAASAFSTVVDTTTTTTETEMEMPHKLKARGVSDTDHQLLLANSLNLLHSQSSGVIMGVASLHWYLGSRKDVTMAKIVKALCRIFRTSRPVRYRKILFF